MAVVLVSLMADSARPAHRAVAGYLARRAGAGEVVFAEGVPWQEQERMLLGGQAQAGFVCGLPYTRHAGLLELLAAPVMSAPRYGGRPRYFSDVVVRAGSHARAFADLRGAAWAYNEPGSFSGYVAVLAHLAALGEGAGFFGRALATGSHAASLAAVLAGAADAAAIDSTVLDHELAARPGLGAELRVVAELGPSPIPPIVAARSLPPEVRGALRHALLHMHEDGAGRAALSAGGIARFAPVADADYDPIRAAHRGAMSLIPTV